MGGGAGTANWLKFKVCRGQVSCPQIPCVHSVKGCWATLNCRPRGVDLSFLQFSLWLCHSHVCPNPSEIHLCCQLEPPLEDIPSHKFITCCVVQDFCPLVLNSPPSWFPGPTVFQDLMNESALILSTPFIGRSFPPNRLREPGQQPV